MTRQTLRQFVRSVDKPFEWGGLDCINFVVDWTSFRGLKPFDSSTNYEYSDLRSARRAAVQFMRRHNSRSIPEVFSKYYNQIDFPAEVGDIVAKKDESLLGWRLGIVEGANGLFVSENGIIGQRLEEGDLFWELR